MRSFSKKKKQDYSCSACLRMVSTGILIKFTNGRGKIGKVSCYKSRSKKNRANTNKVNFLTINESIVLKENLAA